MGLTANGFTELQRKKRKVLKNNIILIICLIISPVLTAQQNFIQVYTSLSEQGAGGIVREDSDGYTLCGNSLSLTNSPTGFFIQKIDKQGNQVWLKEFKEKIYFKASFYPRINNIVQTNDGGFLIAGGDSIVGGRYHGIRIININDSGDILFNMVIDDSVEYYEISDLVGADGSFYLSVKTGTYDMRLIKTDPQGGILWENDYNIASTTYYGVIIKEFSDQTILLAGRSKLVWVRKDGSIIKEQQINPYYINNIALSRNDDIIISTVGSDLQKYDKNGNLLWTRSINTLLDNIAETNDGGLITIPYHFGFNVGLQKYDNVGNKLWEKILVSNQSNMYDLHFIRESSDRGYLISGYYMYTPISSYSFRNYFPMVIKTDSLADVDPSLSLVFPPKEVHASSQYEIEWISDQVNEIDIDFSTNSGSSWIKTADNLSANTGKYIWTVPFGTSDNCLLKISDSGNPALSDIGDSEFAILPVQMKHDYIAANEAKMWIGNNGESSHSPLTDGQGFFWPGGESATKGAVFQDGLVWGGKVDGQIRVGGNTYRAGLLPGNILPDGTRADSGDYQFQVWKLKKDWESVQDEIIRTRYLYNYNNWPVSLGAPWVDVNSDGEYTAGIDHTLYYGDETLFYVSNDLDTNTAKFLYGSDPLGLEVQCLTFAKDTTTGLKDAVFKKYKLINKSSSTITDMYLGYWTDDDMGDANDDFVGVDTLLNLGYTWNGNETDQIYGFPPPSLGHMIIQGPIIESTATDSARFDKGWRKGYKNLPATAFVFYLGGSAVYGDAQMGSYEGTLQMYDNMHGLLGNGSEVIDPNTGNPTVFTLPGDPVTGTGWYEGDGWSGNPPGPGDRRFLISSGPFNMAPGDTQEIGIAIFLAIGSDNVQSIKALREKVPVLQDYYNNELVEELKTTIPAPLTDYRLAQNYPNPFNSTTNIEYTIPQKSVVTIKIYDILGREVRTINQGEQVPWRYKVSFNASALASGVYLYRIEAVPSNGQSGNFIQTKKMVLLK